MEKWVEHVINILIGMTLMAVGIGLTLMMLPLFGIMCMVIGILVMIPPARKKFNL